MLMHLCWKDRTSTTVEDDLVIFPDEIDFKKVTQNTTGKLFSRLGLKKKTKIWIF